MALIACKECTKEVSDSASTCPHCGIALPGISPKQMQQVVKQSRISSGRKLGGGLFLAGALWLAIIALTGGSRETFEGAWGPAKWMMGLGGLWYIVAEIDRNLEERKNKRTTR